MGRAACGRTCWRAARRESRARAEAGHGPAVGRRHDAVHAALFCVRPHPDDRVRERRQPAARARRRPPARNRHPAGDWRVAPPHHLAVAHRKPAARTGVRCARLRHFTARARSRPLRDDEHLVAPTSATFVSTCRQRTGASRCSWLAGAMVSTMFFALAPALQATRFELVRAIRGEVVRDARPGRARNALVAPSGDRIRAAPHLLGRLPAQRVGGGVGRSGHPHGRYRHRGHRERADARGHARRREERADRRLDRGLVAGRAGRAAPALRRAARAGKSTVAYQFVSPEYFSVLGIDLVRGRGFAPTERSASAAVAVVSESVARQLWPGLDAVGQVLRLEPDPNSETRGAGRTAASLAHRRRRRHRPGRGGLSVRRHEDGGGGGLPADRRRGCQDVAHVARARRSRARAPCARRAADGDRSEHGRGRPRCGPSRAWKRIFWRFRSG